jgi:hypothetical protein
MTDEPKPKPERHWGNAAAGFSAACALALSAYTAYLQRQQVKAQVWPILSWGLSATMRDDGDDGDAGLAATDGGALDPDDVPRREASFNFDLKNQGVGPAVIRAMEVTFDGRPIRRWDDLLPSMTAYFKGPHRNWDSHITMIHGRVIAAGEAVKPFEPYGEMQATAMLKVRERIAVKLCYCSVIEDCWEVTAQGLNGSNDPRKVDRCFHPAVPFEQ